ncbi:hypothetical protein JRO89_XS15G0033400 [Xanthoceras sorbifolium]|uniref:Zinc knuckle CX2CX4HX4C domain-containing protein n=1 Tax=Xanthoceras sorbifolium TaxID=99658 RepID=A0ABQ8H0X2_9ROSI|nr:hypothetical protein JRO89_XS15G0033400 [Xanthoceras sorbifolium]
MWVHRGLFLRLRVAIDISKPLKRVLRVKLDRMKEEKTLLLKYERLPEYCLCCGLVGHSYRECPDNGDDTVVGSKPMIDGSSSTKRDHSISGKVGMVAANGNPHQNLVEEIMETGVHESLNHENGRHQEFREEADHMEIVELIGLLTNGPSEGNQVAIDLAVNITGPLNKAGVGSYAVGQ